MENSAIECEYWYGELCYEKSQMEEKQIFPMTDDGRAAMQAWLESKI